MYGVRAGETDGQYICLNVLSERILSNNMHVPRPSALFEGMNELDCLIDLKN